MKGPLVSISRIKNRFCHSTTWIFAASCCAMHRVFLLLAAAVCVRAGTIQGVVLEQASGRPLARTVVRLDSVPESGGAKKQGLTTRAALSGHFVFPAIAPGVYLLIAVREGYFPAAYGQRLPTGRGTPIYVSDESNFFAEIRLRRKGAITGRVLDENGVARAGVSVLAYRTRLPLRAAGTGLSDDRGVYRIHGLDPGKYWVRSAAHTLDDGSSWLPTFGPQSREVRDAGIHLVTVDADTTDADISPEPGPLFHLSGLISGDVTGPVLVTLSSETGRHQANSICPVGGYQFDGLAPGVYEVFATLPDGSAAGFIELFLDRDYGSATVQVTKSPVVDIEVRPANVAVTLTGRRQYMSEGETPHDIPRPRATLTPGHWEMRASVRAGQYVESIDNLRSAPRRPSKVERVSDWFEVFVESRAPARIRITVSDQAGQISGRAMTDAKGVARAPLFLWAAADSARRSLGGALQTRVGTDGRVRFAHLPPWAYPRLARFD